MHSASFTQCMHVKFDYSKQPGNVLYIAKKLKKTFGLPFEKMNSLVSLKHNKTKRREGEKSRVPRHILKSTCQNKGSHLEWNQLLFFKLFYWWSQTVSKVTQPCRDVDQHHMFPASELFAGNFALRFQVSVRCETATCVSVLLRLKNW